MNKHPYNNGHLIVPERRSRSRKGKDKGRNHPMRKARFIVGVISLLVLFSPAVSSSQIAYVIDASAPYSYVSGTTPITDWVCEAPLCNLSNKVTDEGYFDLPLGDFNFQFYGVPVTTLRIVTNGYMTFGTSAPDFFNRPIPSSQEPNALIAPFWTDLDLSLSGQVRWGISGTSPSRQLVVEWLEVPPYGADLGVRYSFEAILYESTNEIVFQYSNVIYFFHLKARQFVAYLRFGCVQPK